MRTSRISCALLLSLAWAGRAGGMDESRVREALMKQVQDYLATTRTDFTSNPRYPNLRVDLTSADMESNDSLVTPFTAEVRYMLEYDDTWHKGVRVIHPFVMSAKWFSGRWDIDPHGHRKRKNLTDLNPERSQILFPNL